MAIPVPIIAIQKQLQIVLWRIELKVCIGLLEGEKRDVPVLAMEVKQIVAIFEVEVSLETQILLEPLYVLVDCHHAFEHVAYVLVQIRFIGGPKDLWGDIFLLRDDAPLLEEPLIICVHVGAERLSEIVNSSPRDVYCSLGPRERTLLSILGPLFHAQA